jgi:hypothetical protein
MGREEYTDEGELVLWPILATANFRWNGDNPLTLNFGFA